MLINLQRHADHHLHPQRRFPLLQVYSEAEVPLLPTDDLSGDISTGLAADVQSAGARMAEAILPGHHLLDPVQDRVLGKAVGFGLTHMPIRRRQCRSRPLSPAQAASSGN